MRLNEEKKGLDFGFWEIKSGKRRYTLPGTAFESESDLPKFLFSVDIKGAFFLG